MPRGAPDLVPPYFKEAPYSSCPHGLESLDTLAPEPPPPPTQTAAPEEEPAEAAEAAEEPVLEEAEASAEAVKEEGEDEPVRPAEQYQWGDLNEG
ncbi:MAG: hypothetical protein JRI25_02670 [Deltaproteobacteria bacterium]|nr:hypothetical protein [Deltaproteobacteria bacterium]